MKEREEEFPASTHATIMRSVRVMLPLQAWGARAYVLLTAGLSLYSLVNTVQFMIERRAFEFVQVALDGLALDISAWPYFSSVAFEFIPSGWSIAFLINGFLLCFGLFVLRRGRLQTLSF